jgi:hypothetical protein
MKQTAVEYLMDKLSINDCLSVPKDFWYEYLELLEEAKEIENGKHKRFNEFLDDEKILGISDLKTIERIKWYYNTYFNETYGGNK